MDKIPAFLGPFSMYSGHFVSITVFMDMGGRYRIPLAFVFAVKKPCPGLFVDYTLLVEPDVKSVGSHAQVFRDDTGGNTVFCCKHLVVVVHLRSLFYQHIILLLDPGVFYLQL